VKNWTIEDWTRAIAQNNRDKGWRDERVFGTQTVGAREEARFVGAQLMLIVTEVAEACEDVREGNYAPSTNSQNGKPEGLPSELADIVIRTLDLADMLGIDLSAAMAEKHSYNLGRAHRHGGKLL
jgi:NTP pyrophosphatase (non-canonical NTP hydrolase)